MIAAPVLTTTAGAVTVSDSSPPTVVVATGLAAVTVTPAGRPVMVTVTVVPVVGAGVVEKVVYCATVAKAAGNRSTIVVEITGTPGLQVAILIAALKVTVVSRFTNTATVRTGSVKVIGLVTG